MAQYAVITGILFHYIHLINPGGCSTLPADWRSRIHTSVLAVLDSESTSVNRTSRNDIIEDESSYGLRTTTQRTGQLFAYNYWPNNGKCIPFVLHPAFENDPDTRQSILNALRTIERRTHSCLTFTLRSNEPEYITIQPGRDARGCEADVGRTPGKATRIRLGRECMKQGVILHELLHALGFFHEHNRPDRDDYLEVFSDHIEPGKYDPNFVVLANMSHHGVQYDFESIMHYAPWAFAQNTSKPTMLPKVRIPVKMGQQEYLSALDVIKLKRAYGCIDEHFEPVPPAFSLSCTVDHYRNAPVFTTTAVSTTTTAFSSKKTAFSATTTAFSDKTTASSATTTAFSTTYFGKGPEIHGSSLDWPEVSLLVVDESTTPLFTTYTLPAVDSVEDPESKDLSLGSEETSSIEIEKPTFPSKESTTGHALHSSEPAETDAVQLQANNCYAFESKGLPKWVMRDADAMSTLAHRAVTAAVQPGDLSSVCKTVMVTSNKFGEIFISLPKENGHRLVITIATAGYYPITLRNIRLDGSEDGTYTYMEPLLFISNSFPGIGVASRKVKGLPSGNHPDVEQRHPVNLVFRSGMNTYIGSPLMTLITSADGAWNVRLYAGHYTVTASKNGYITTTFTVVVIGEKKTLYNFIKMSPILDRDQILIISLLKCRTTCASVFPDLHILGPTENGPRSVHVFLNDRKSPNGFLDYNITKQLAGVYRISASDYLSIPNARWEMGYSCAAIQLYTGNKLWAEYFWPNRLGNVWNVVEINGKKLKALNEMKWVANYADIM